MYMAKSQATKIGSHKRDNKEDEIETYEGQI